jgi:hypothetical protein
MPVTGSTVSRFYALVIGATISTNSLAECACAVRPESELFLSADAVFIGRPVRYVSLMQSEESTTIKDGQQYTTITVPAAAPLIYIVKPSEVLKDPHKTLRTAGGEPKRFVYVLQDSEGDCGASFREGQDMVLLVVKSGLQFLSTNQCMGSATVASAREFVEKLRKIRATLEKLDTP